MCTSVSSSYKTRESLVCTDLTKHSAMCYRDQKREKHIQREGGKEGGREGKREGAREGGRERGREGGRDKE